VAKKSAKEELDKEAIKLILDTLDTVCKMLIALKPILDGLRR